MNTCLLVLGLTLGCGATADGESGRTTTADPWIGEDKLRHLALSFAATEMTYGSARFILDHDTAVPVAATTALALGLAKELRDRREGRTFSTRDLVWNVAGVALGVALVRSTR